MYCIHSYASLVASSPGGQAGGGCDAMALGNVAAGYMEAASDSCEL